MRTPRMRWVIQRPHSSAWPKQYDAPRHRWREYYRASAGCGCGITTKVWSTIAAISRKPISPARNRATATSLAALRTVGAAPPARKAARAKRIAGNRSASGASKVNVPIWAKSNRAHGAFEPFGPPQSDRQSACACRAYRAGPAPNRRRIPPCCGPPTAGGSGSRCGRRQAQTDDGPRLPRGPLFMIVALSTEILAPIDHVGMGHGLGRGRGAHLGDGTKSGTARRTP